MKRYLDEQGSQAVRAAMDEAGLWLSCRIAYTETLKAIARDVGIGDPAASSFQEEWQRFDVVDVDQDLVEIGARLAIEDGLRTLGALHLAAALLIPDGDRTLATWDGRLWSAAKHRGFRLLPDEPPAGRG